MELLVARDGFFHRLRVRNLEGKRAGWSRLKGFRWRDARFSRWFFIMGIRW